MKSYNHFLDEAVAAAGLARLAAKGKLGAAKSKMAADGLKAAAGSPKASPSSSALAIRKPKALPSGGGGAIVKPTAKQKALPGNDGGKLARVNKGPGSIVRTSTTPDKKPKVSDEGQTGNKPGTSRRPSDWGTKPGGDWESGSGKKETEKKERKPFKIPRPTSDLSGLGNSDGSVEGLTKRNTQIR